MYHSKIYGVYQRIVINNRSPRSTFCRRKLLQILSLCVSGGGETAGREEVVSSRKGEGGGQTVHRERESGAVQDDRKLSVGFC